MRFFVLFCHAEPDFVSSSVVELSADNNVTGEDDRIYFFFNEAAMEYNFYSKVRVPRVARVCRVRIQIGFYRFFVMKSWGSLACKRPLQVLDNIPTSLLVHELNAYLHLCCRQTI